ncbi:MAG: septum formation inhibitor Maf [Rickettsiaceae bacterium]|nr:septum formation inhibitor Maf [Rickettsiaceae bacterium]
MKLPIILASSSKSRLNLLKQIGIIPDKIIPADIDECSKPKELPPRLASRLAFEKATKIANNFNQGIIIGADTVPVIGRTAIGKAETDEDVRRSLQLLSQRRHRIYTAVCVIYKNEGVTRTSQRLVKTILKFKKLSDKEIDYYCGLKEGLGKAGGYSVAGYAGSFIAFISGSFSNVIGLPLFETKNMLESFGYNKSLVIS